MISADSKHVPLSRRKSPESSRSRRGKRSECGHPSSFMCVACYSKDSRQYQRAWACSEGLQYLVCVCVYLSAAILTLQAMRRPMSDNNSFQTTQSWNNKIAIFLKRLCLRDVPCKAKKPISVIALAYHDLIRSLCVPWDAQEVTTKDLYRLPHAI